MGKVITHFGRHVTNLSHSEKHVLYYIDNHLEEAKELSLTEMANSVSVSTTTIIRMCHKLKLSGFSELKFILQSMKLTERSTDENILERYQKSIINTINHIDPDDLVQIAQLMVKVDKIVIASVGLSKMMGEYLSKLLMQVNKTALYVYEYHIIDSITSAASPDDLIIFISSSGETKTLTDVAEKLKYTQIRTVSITNNMDNSLNKLTTFSLVADSQSIKYDGYDITTRSSLMILIDLLFDSYLAEIS